MKNSSKKILSMLLVFAMLMPTLCIGTFSATAAYGEQVAVQPSAGQVVDTNDYDLIKYADSLANGVQAYFKNADRDHFVVENAQMSFQYALREKGNMQLSYLKDKDGNSYFENSFDAFVVMDGSDERVYASNSGTTALPNLHRFGYYYYDTRIEGQNFISEYEIKSSSVKKYGVEAGTDVTWSHPSSIIGTTTYGEFSGQITSSEDPHVTFKKESSGWVIKNDAVNFSADKYQYIRITMSTDETIRSASIFFGVPGDNDESGNAYDFSEKMRVDFTLTGNGVNGTPVEYMVPMFTNSNYTGTVDALRLDFNGQKGDEFHVTKIELVEVEMGDHPYGLYVNRDFLVYTDKMHSYTQFTATQELTNLAEVGVEIKLPKNTVDGFVIKADGTSYNNSLDVNDWASAEYVGFIVKGVGVFGYILPADNSVGKLTVTDDGNNYVISQTVNPANSTITPSYAGMKDEHGNADPNGNDIFVGQRIYTDDNSDLAAFVKEAEIERNPLTAENFIIGEGSEGSFAGYDAIRGIYKLAISGYGGFNDPFYYAQNKKFKVNFTVKGDNCDRNIWVMTRTECQSLECAVILDANEMMIPIPIQVGKNFSESHGERNKFNLDDPVYGEAIIPMQVKSGSEAEYNFLNLYQNWGNYPLKQISWIQYSSPYYHLSTGVSESNCITPLYSMGKTTTNGTLPDFRGMSSPLWSDQPQHNSCGNHKWLIYTDNSGKRVATESTSNIITSFGPTYAEVKMSYITDDGKIKVTYTHMEMPQTDENRTYYEMQYEVLEDVSFSDFKNQLQFYSVKTNDPTGYYTRLGYLNVDNVSTVVEAKREGSGTAQYVLGKECPYFSYFDMDNASSEHNQPKQAGYSNVAFLIYNSDFTIGGDQADPDFIVTDRGGEIAVSLNLDAVTLKKDDKFTINAILLPWGSQEMEGQYDTIQDKNVREVRENTLLDPVKITPLTNAESVDSVYLPVVKTTNGKNATFKVSGGENNVTIRVDGFKKLTDPVIYELVNGKWERLTLCSLLTPDSLGNADYYDGYSVTYDSETDTYSYSFVTTLTADQSRTFKVDASADFDGWDSVTALVDLKKDMNFIVDGEALYKGMSDVSNIPSKVLNPEPEEFDYVRYTSKPSTKDGYFYVYKDENPNVTGNYIVIKYRFPSNPGLKTGWIDLYCCTDSKSAGGANYSVSNSVLSYDDEWHILIVDIAERNRKNFVREEDGTSKAKHLRMDPFNFNKESDHKTAFTMDIAYIGLSDSISEILAYDSNYKDIILTTTGSDAVKLTAPQDIATISVAEVKAEVGEEIIVPVTISGNTGLSYLDIMPVFESEKFTFVGIQNGDVLENVSVANSHIIWSNTADSVANGNLVNLVFRANESVSNISSYSFGVKVVDANSISGKGTNTEVVSGKVVFGNVVYGDVNGDGIVTVLDVVTLRKYFANYDYATMTSTVEVFIGADVNCDEVINTNDLRILREYFANYDYDENRSNVILGN